MKLFVAAIIFGAVLTATPANASHDTIYSPCSTEYGYIHMTYDEWAAHITTMEADGTIPPGVVFRYWEANHTTGKGTNVQEDGTIPAWDQWARNLEDGMILSIDDWANGDYPEIEELMFASGKVPEWVLDANMVIRRFNDPYWGVANPLTPTFTVWQSLCMADYGYSIPIMEINEDGVWESNLPTTTTTSTTTTTTTTLPPDPEPGPTQEQEAPEPEVPAPTTTAVALTEAPGMAPEQELSEITNVSSGETTPTPNDAPYTLFDAEWDGYPFEATVRLLEDRYPIDVEGKTYFKLSAAVEYLRAGGMVRGLDNLWNS